MLFVLKYTCIVSVCVYAYNHIYMFSVRLHIENTQKSNGIMLIFIQVYDVIDSLCMHVCMCVCKICPDFCNGAQKVDTVRYMCIVALWSQSIQRWQCFNHLCTICGCCCYCYYCCCLFVSQFLLSLKLKSTLSIQRQLYIYICRVFHLFIPSLTLFFNNNNDSQHSLLQKLIRLFTTSAVFLCSVSGHCITVSNTIPFQYNAILLFFSFSDCVFVIPVAIIKGKLNVRGRENYIRDLQQDIFTTSYSCVNTVYDAKSFILLQNFNVQPPKIFKCTV